MENRSLLSKGGRLVLPVKMRKALDLKSGDEVILRLEGDSIRVIPLAQAVAQAQRLVRSHVKPGRSLADELIQARRKEAQDE